MHALPYRLQRNAHCHCEGNCTVSNVVKTSSSVVGASGATVVMRACFIGNFIQGNTDFIFGHGAAVFNASTIQYTATRKGSNTIYIFVPSTCAGSRDGFLVTGSTLNSTGDVRSNTIYLGRAWDESGGSLTSSVNGSSPNGQIVICDSTLDGHIRKATPWAPSTVSRIYGCSGCTYSPNRFFE